MTKRAATVAVVVVLLALAGCGPAQRAANPDVGLSDIPPNEVSGIEIPDGRVAEAISKVDGLVNELMRASGIPGVAVAIVHGGKTVGGVLGLV